MAATLGELKAALVSADKAGDQDGARRLAAAITHMQSNGQQLYAPPEKPLGFVESVGEAITGDKRKTSTTTGLPDWAGMPELNSLSLASAKTGVGTLLSSPKETASIIKANFPQAQIRQDEKGNYVIKSSIDGQEYAIKPGFQVSDIPRALGALVAFTPAGRAATLPGMAAAAAGTQAVIEGSQAATGGEFNPAEVLIAGATGAAVPAVASAVRAVKAPAMAALDRALGKTAAVEPPPIVSPSSGAPVTPVVNTPPVAPMPAADLAQTAKTAASGGMGAKSATEQLASQAMPDPKTIEAAQRLGIVDYLQPDHVSTNQAYRELAQAVKSVPGSTTRASEIEGLNAVGKRADDLINELGGSQDFSTLNANIKSRLQGTQQELDKTAEQLYATIRKTIPAKTEAPATNVLDFINQRADELGGVANLTPAEKQILAKLSPKPLVEIKAANLPPAKHDFQTVYRTENANPAYKGKANFGDGKYFSKDIETAGEMQLDPHRTARTNWTPEQGGVESYIIPPGTKLKTINIEKMKAIPSGEELKKQALSEGYDGLEILTGKNLNFGGDQVVLFKTASPVVNKITGEKLAINSGVRQPTYALLDDVRRDLGSAGKMTGPFKDADVGLAKKLYGLLSQDQEAIAKANGATELFDAARSAVKIRKGVEDDLVALFGKTLDNSIVGNLAGAVKSLPSGDSTKLVKLLKLIPDDMRQEVMATGLNTAFGKQFQNGSLNFNTYAKWYEGLLQNKQAHAAVMSNLPPQARKQLSDLYRVSKGVNMATRERITTGRIQAVQQELLGTDSLIENLYNVAKRSTVGLAAEAITTPLGAPGAGLAAGVTSALMRNKPNAMKAVDALISSPEFTVAIKRSP